MTKFYTNLENLDNEHHYEPQYIWNIHETGSQASENGIAKRSSRGVYKAILTERKWLSVLSTINANRGTILNYYIFKGVRQMKNYVAYCEKNAMIGMQKRAQWTPLTL